MRKTNPQRRGHRSDVIRDDPSLPVSTCSPASVRTGSHWDQLGAHCFEKKLGEVVAKLEVQFEAAKTEGSGPPRHSEKECWPRGFDRFLNKEMVDKPWSTLPYRDWESKTKKEKRKRKKKKKKEKKNWNMIFS